jgi:hypothetical protein
VVGTTIGRRNDIPVSLAFSTTHGSQSPLNVAERFFTYYDGSNRVFQLDNGLYQYLTRACPLCRSPLQGRSTSFAVDYRGFYDQEEGRPRQGCLQVGLALGSFHLSIDFHHGIRWMLGCRSWSFLPPLQSRCPDQPQQAWIHHAYLAILKEEGKCRLGRQQVFGSPRMTFIE